MGVFPSGQWGQTVNLLLFSFGGSNPPAPTKNSSIRTGCWSFCFVETYQGDRSGWIRTASAAAIRPGGKKPLRGFFRCAARAIHPRPPRTPVSEPGLEFRNVYRDSGTCRNKASRAWCSWMSKKLFVSGNKSAPGCFSLEEELSGGCYWMHFIFAGAFSSGHCSRMFPAFCPGPDTRRGCTR